VALNYLERRGIIQLSRAQIIILDRTASAIGSYHQAQA
jgi:rRNA processing protein Krr1/Pno1